MRAPLNSPKLYCSAPSCTRWTWKAWLTKQHEDNNVRPCATACFSHLAPLPQPTGNVLKAEGGTAVAQALACLPNLRHLSMQRMCSHVIVFASGYSNKESAKESTCCCCCCLLVCLFVGSGNYLGSEAGVAVATALTCCSELQTLNLRRTGAAQQTQTHSAQMTFECCPACCSQRMSLIFKLAQPLLKPCCAVPACVSLSLKVRPSQPRC